MMLVKFKGNINFMKYRKIALALSLALVLASIVLLMVRGLNFGIDFSGGILFQLEFDAPVTVAEVRSSLDKIGFGSPVIQSYSERGVLVRLKGDRESDQREILKSLRKLWEWILKFCVLRWLGPLWEPVA